MSHAIKEADTWKAMMTKRIQAIRSELLDRIDVGTPDRRPTPRKPSARERASQDRADGNFEPTPPGTNSTPIHASDPVGRQVLRWESDVQRVTTWLFSIVAAADEVVVQLGLKPVDENGHLTVAPDEPDTDRTDRGSIVTVADASMCRIAILEACNWLTSAVDVIADRLAKAEGDAGQSVRDRARYIGQVTGQLVRRLEIYEERTCKCGCGRPCSPGEATAAACRQRQSRERRVA